MNKEIRPKPVLDPWNSPFWSGVAEGHFRLQKCEACSTYWFPPGPRCPECGSSTWTWSESSGNGAVLSHCTFHQGYFPGLADLIPYEVVIVQLDEGPIIISNIIAAPGSPKVNIGDRVRVLFRADSEGFNVPAFEAIHV